MRIYVGNLSYDTTEEKLKKLFSEKGEVESATLVTDKYSGRSKGFGFIEMPQADQAQAVISALNGTDLDGRSITVNEARARTESGGGGRGGYGGGGGGGGGYGRGGGAGGRSRY